MTRSSLLGLTPPPPKTSPVVQLWSQVTVKIIYGSQLVIGVVTSCAFFTVNISRQERRDIILGVKVRVI